MTLMMVNIFIFRTRSGAKSEDPPPAREEVQDSAGQGGRHQRAAGGRAAAAAQVARPRSLQRLQRRVSSVQ